MCVCACACACVRAALHNNYCVPIVPQRLHLYNQDQQQRPSCRYATPSTPDSPDVVILCVSDNEDASFSTPLTKQ